MHTGGGERGVTEIVHFFLLCELEEKIYQFKN